MVMSLPTMLLPLPSSLPKLHTTTSRTPSPVMSASPTQAVLLPKLENGVPTRDRLPAPSFLNTDTLPTFWRLALTATPSCQPAPFMSAALTKLTVGAPGGGTAWFDQAVGWPDRAGA